MALSDYQVRQFKEQGYTVAPTMFSQPEVSAIRAELDRLRQAGAFLNVATEGDGATQSKAKENLQICPLYKRSDFFRALPFNPKVIETISQLIGDPVVLHLDQVFLKPARHGSGTSWHQDNAYFKIPDPTRGTAMWIAVHDATIANGTLEVIPGLFREKLEHARDPNSNHHIRCWPPEDKAIPIEIPAGGAIFFAYGTPHCTRANQTDHDRAALAYHFLNQDQISAQNRENCIGTVLSGPAADDGEKAHGQRITGTWAAHVDRMLVAPR